MTALLVGFFWTHHGWRNGNYLSTAIGTIVERTECNKK